jgi:hypothetical protein
MTTLIWPVKGSFLRYISNVGGVMWVGEGAWAADDGFAFLGATDVGSGAMQFRGALIFDAHAGALHVELTDPTLEPGGDSWAVRAYTDENRTSPLLFAEATESSRVAGAVTFMVRLTAAGSLLFGGNYPEGAELDPLIVETADRIPPG